MCSPRMLCSWCERVGGRQLLLLLLLLPLLIALVMWPSMLAVVGSSVRWVCEPAGARADSTVGSQLVLPTLSTCSGGCIMLSVGRASSIPSGCAQPPLPRCAAAVQAVKCYVVPSAFAGWFCFTAHLLRTLCKEKR